MKIRKIWSFYSHLLDEILHFAKFQPPNDFFSSVLFHPARGILIYLDEILHFAKFQPADEFFSSSDSVLCTEEIYI